jgi:hypothetical protein
MTEATFRSAIALLSAYYGNQPGDVVYKLTWEVFKQMGDKFFEEICKQLILEFKPTSQVPFPLIPHFIDAKNVVNNRKRNHPEYRQIEERYEPPDEETWKMIKETVERIKNK